MLDSERFAKLNVEDDLKCICRNISQMRSQIIAVMIYDWLEIYMIDLGEGRGHIMYNS